MKVTSVINEQNKKKEGHFGEAMIYRIFQNGTDHRYIVNTISEIYQIILPFSRLKHESGQ